MHNTCALQGPGSTSTPVMARSSTKKSGNKFRYSWHVTDLDDVIPNGGTPNSEVRYTNVHVHVHVWIWGIHLVGGDFHTHTEVDFSYLKFLRCT